MCRVKAFKASQKKTMNATKAYKSMSALWARHPLRIPAFDTVWKLLQPDGVKLVARSSSIFCNSTHVLAQQTYISTSSDR